MSPYILSCQNALWAVFRNKSAQSMAPVNELHASKKIIKYNSVSFSELQDENLAQWL